MKKIYLAFFSFLLLFTACKKDKPDSFANLLARKTLHFKKTMQYEKALLHNYSCNLSAAFGL